MAQSKVIRCNMVRLASSTIGLIGPGFPVAPVVFPDSPTKRNSPSGDRSNTSFLSPRRILPLMLVLGCIFCMFALSIGVTHASNHHCYAGVCGSWLFPIQARQHVGVWYLWLTLSSLFLAVRAFCSPIRRITSAPLFGMWLPVMGKRVTVGGLMMVVWQLFLYGILVFIWWQRLREYFQNRGGELPGNDVVAFVAQSGHLADVTMGMVLLPVTRHSALAAFFKLSPSTNFLFHIINAYILFFLVALHGLAYARWVALYNAAKDRFRMVLPVLNPTYLYHEVWPGDKSGLGIWRASLIFSGILASLIMMAMFLTSFPVVRRKHYNIFYFTHLTGILGVVAICLHASTMFYCTAPGLSLWLLDWAMRAFELRQKVDGRLTSLGRGWYRYISE